MEIDNESKLKEALIAEIRHVAEHGPSHQYSKAGCQGLFTITEKQIIEIRALLKMYDTRITEIKKGRANDS